ncbi:hypothetical protein ACHAXA_007416 [Cyclostephanos tholiformis]|uniref:C3H1-type domain-containing protein n=1 Tax=Cyclostephanos tholiformis TaxID=382380 RepID=A0ABD3SCZ9_9STRA
MDEKNDTDCSVSATSQMEVPTPAAPVDDAATAVDNHTYNFEKRGTHKLVVKRKVDPFKNIPTVSATQRNNFHFKVNGRKDAAFSSKPSTPENFLMQSTHMNSSNTATSDRHSAKLVASAEAEHATSGAMVDHSISRMVDRRRKVETSYETSSSIYIPGKSHSWTRKPSDDTSKDFMTKPADGSTTRGNVEFVGQNMGLQRKRKHEASSSGPRRIHLLKNSITIDTSRDLSGEESELVGGAINENTIEKNGSALSADRKILTDFCYQDAGRRGGNGRGGGLSSARSGVLTEGRNMGLVRVKPNDEAAICVKFLCGLQCNNPKCTLRHDVETEALRPVCVFFQRKGMCNKGDECPFRHVKVRWDAEKSKK